MMQSLTIGSPRRSPERIGSINSSSTIIQGGNVSPGGARTSKSVESRNSSNNNNNRKVLQSHHRSRFFALHRENVFTILIVQLLLLLCITLSIVPFLALQLGSASDKVHRDHAAATAAAAAAAAEATKEEAIVPDASKQWGDIVQEEEKEGGIVRPETSIRRRIANNDADETADATQHEMGASATLSISKAEGEAEAEDFVTVGDIAAEDEYNNRDKSNNENAEDGEYDDDLPLIHIVNTRFMQEQKNLIQLANARIKLFETFCLPTMLTQTIQPDPDGGEDDKASVNMTKSFRFLWIIKTDPKLDDVVRERLVTLLRPHRNFFLVGSNNNFGIGVRKGSWRGGESGSDILENPEAKIYTGDVKLLQRAHETREEKIVIETRLDADDGFPSNFLEFVQEKALLYLDSGSDLNLADDYDDGGRSDDEIDQYQRDIALSENIMLSTKQNDEEAEGDDQDKDQEGTEGEEGEKEEEEGVMQVDNNSEEEVGMKDDEQLVPTTTIANKNKNGKASWMFWCMAHSVNWYPALSSFFDEKRGLATTLPPYETDPGRLEIDTNNGKVVCLTPGLTLGLSVGEPNDEMVPRYGHYDLIHELAVQTDQALATGQEAEVSCDLERPVDCVQLVDMRSVRSRTPTSAGMKGLWVKEVNKTLDEIDSLWDEMNLTYSISRQRALQTNQYLTDHAVEIMQDNLKGQCTKGHSCKHMSKVILRKMLEAVGGKDAVPPKKPWEK